MKRLSSFYYKAEYNMKQCIIIEQTNVNTEQSSTPMHRLTSETAFGQNANLVCYSMHVLW